MAILRSGGQPNHVVWVCPGCGSEAELPKGWEKLLWNKVEASHACGWMGPLFEFRLPLVVRDSAPWSGYR